MKLAWEGVVAFVQFHCDGLSGSGVGSLGGELLRDTRGRLVSLTLGAEAEMACGWFGVSFT